jgi:hypothetical protein
MGPRNLLILFFSTVAVSLVILIIFFSLFFKNVDLNFNTRLPESAPDIGRQFGSTPTMSPESKADGLMRSTVNVPPEMREPDPAHAAGKTKKTDSEDIADSDLPPISDDVMLEHDRTADPASPERSPQPESTDVNPSDRHTTNRNENTPTTAPAPRNPRPVRRQVEAPPPPQTPVAMPVNPAPVEQPEPSGPPVPGQ